MTRALRAVATSALRAVAGSTLGAVAASTLLACGGGSTVPSPPRVGAAPGPVAPTAPVERVLPALPDLAGVAGPPDPLLVVSVSGLVPEAYGRGASPGPATMPMLAALAARGVAADGMRPVAPGASQPAHATLLTGREPAAHGIGAARPMGPLGASRQGSREASAMKARTLFDAAREAGVRSAAIGWPATAGAPVDQLFPALFPARVGETSLGLLEGTASADLLAAARRLGAEQPEAGYPGPVRDQLLVDIACEALDGTPAPRLLLLHLSQTAAPLGRDGPGSAAVRAAFASVDRQLARLVVCLEETGKLASAALVVVGDVAFQPVHTLVRPNAALDAAGLLVPTTGGGAGVQRWDAWVRTSGGSGLVHARTQEDAVLARRALGEVARESGAFRVVSAEELLALGVDREAWFGLEALPGYVLGDATSGPLLRPSPVRGAAGYLADAPDRRPGFVAWGVGVRERIRIPALSQVDVAPTVARLVGLALPETDGRVLIGALRGRLALGAGEP